MLSLNVATATLAETSRSWRCCWVWEARMRLSFVSCVLAGVLLGAVLLTQAAAQNDGASGGEAIKGQDGVPMALIPAGAFTMGSNEGLPNERPEHSVTLDAYYLDRYEVTNAQYAAFVKATGHRKSGPPSRYAKNTGRMRGVNQPAVYVSWDDAKAYCEWRGRRLPTEAEWEKAMRGPDGRLWPWGNVEIPGGANWARVDDGFEVAAPVGRVRSDASPYGVMDGAGNVMEWVADWYLEGAYAAASDRNPESPEYGTYRVLRGAAYTSSGSDLRITARSKMMSDFRDETIGFRCAQSSATAGRISGIGSQ